MGDLIECTETNELPSDQWLKLRGRNRRGLRDVYPWRRMPVGSYFRFTAGEDDHWRLELVYRAHRAWKDDGARWTLVMVTCHGAPEEVVQRMS